MNFIDNAIYYSHPDSTVTINLVGTKDAVALTIVDTGIGVPQAEQARLFKKFFRAKNARTQRPDGNGRRVVFSRGSHLGASWITDLQPERGQGKHLRLPTAYCATRLRS